jgi:hypothetical protein
MEWLRRAQIGLLFLRRIDRCFLLANIKSKAALQAYISLLLTRRARREATRMPDRDAGL